MKIKEMSITVKDDFAGDYINNLTLNYTIKPKEVGAVYGTISVKNNRKW